MKPASSTLSERLVQAREQRDLKQDKVAALARMTQQSYSDLERGVSKRTTRIGSLSHVLAVDAYWLETGEGSPTQRVIGVSDAVGDYEVISDQERALIYAVRKLPSRQQSGLFMFLGINV